MPILSKKKHRKALEAKKEDMVYLFEGLSSELEDTEKKLENINYQIEFFGGTAELEEEKQDCILMLSWIQDQFDSVKQSLFEINSHSLISPDL